MTRKGQALSVLLVSTLAFTVCFMVWMMFGVIGIPIKKALNLNATEFGLLTATPVLTGSLIRVPLGIWTDKFGGRIVMASLMALTIASLTLLYALVVVLLTRYLAQRLRAHPLIGRTLEKTAGMLLLGFGLKLALSK